MMSEWRNVPQISTETMRNAATGAGVKNKVDWRRVEELFRRRLSAEGAKPESNKR